MVVFPASGPEPLLCPPLYMHRNTFVILTCMQKRIESTIKSKEDCKFTKGKPMTLTRTRPHQQRDTYQVFQKFFVGFVRRDYTSNVTQAVQKNPIASPSENNPRYKINFIHRRRSHPLGESASPTSNEEIKVYTYIPF